MKDPKALKVVNVKLPVALILRVKVKAAKLGQTMQSVIERSITRGLHEYGSHD